MKNGMRHGLAEAIRWVGALTFLVASIFLIGRLLYLAAPYVNAAISFIGIELSLLAAIVVGIVVFNMAGWVSPIDLSDGEAE